MTRWKIIEENENNTFSQVVQDLESQHGCPVIEAKMVSRKILATSPNTILVRFEVPTQSLTYVPGDHLAVFPTNPDIDVDLVLSHLSGIPGDPRNTLVQLQEPSEFGQFWEPARNGLPAVPLRRLFQRHLNLTGAPSQEFLREMAKHAFDSAEKKALKSLAADYLAFDQWRKTSEPSIADVFRKFHSIRVDSAQFVNLLSALMPR